MSEPNGSTKVVGGAGNVSESMGVGNAVFLTDCAFGEACEFLYRFYQSQCVPFNALPGWFGRLLDVYGDVQHEGYCVAFADSFSEAESVTRHRKHYVVIFPDPDAPEKCPGVAFYYPDDV